jgi:TRAP transporter 4TM/12TM fusion protein
MGAVDESGQKVGKHGVLFWDRMASVLSVLFVVFQVYTAGFGQYPNLIQRSIHSAFCLCLCFLILPTFKKKSAESRGRPSTINIALAVLAGICCLYIAADYDRLMESVGLAASPLELAMGIALLLLALESARRATGVILPLLAVASIFYALFGDLIPGGWGHPGFKWEYVVEYLYITPEGIWGTLTGISATLVAAYIIFGAILLSTGGAASFMNIALLAGGKSYGGAAKVATMASALFGMLSGAAIANVATTGNFTIPMMKRLGYKPEFAAGVEATASSGGQITPPIMGAGAFIMSELIGEPYIKIAVSATLPAFLFFSCVWMSIDLEARKVKLTRVPQEEIPPLRSVFKWAASGPVTITILVVLASLFMGHTPTKAAFFGIMTNLFLFVFSRPFSRGHLVNRLRAVLKGVEQAGKGMVTVVSLLICAQIVISMISLTGAGIKLSEVIIGASAGSLFLALLLAAAVCLILGMGMPTTAAYVLAASVVGPALNMMGVASLSAHMFMFYCALISALTPPVCTAVFTAAAIANTSWLKVAGVAVRLAIMKYIIPFFFIYRPSILLMGHWYRILETIVVSMLSAMLFAVGTVGYYRLPINIFARAFVLAVALILIMPGLTTDLIGVLCMAGLVIWQKAQAKSLAVEGGREAQARS